MQEMNGAVLEVARSAGQASELSTQVRKKAQAGAKIVKEVGDSMITLQEQSNTLKADMNKFEEHAPELIRVPRSRHTPTLNALTDIDTIIIQSTDQIIASINITLISNTSLLFII